MFLEHKCCTKRILGFLGILLFIAKGTDASSNTTVDIDPDTIWLVGAGWGAISAVSLPLGALIGLSITIDVQTRAAFMAFGAGALIFASALELFGSGLHHAEEFGNGPLYAMVGSAVFGGLLFEGINSFVEGEGAFYRIFSRLRMHLSVYGRRTLIEQLSRYHLFEGVEDEQLLMLCQRMFTCTYEAEDDISFDIDSLSPVYLILNGSVEVTVVDPSQTYGSPSPKGTGLNPVGTVYESTPMEEYTADTLTDLSRAPGTPRVAMRRGSTGFTPQLSKLSAGDMFGHLSLFTGRTAHCIVRCMEHTTLLHLRRSDLNTVISSTASFQDAVDSLRQALNQIAGEDANVAVLDQVLPNLHHLHYGVGEDISFDVDEWSPVYHITSGTVDISYRLDGQSETTDVLSAGDFLPSVLWFLEGTGQKTPKRVFATVSAEARAIVIPREDFNRLMASSTLRRSVSKKGQAQQERHQGTAVQVPLSDLEAKEPIPLSFSTRPVSTSTLIMEEDEHHGHDAEHDDSDGQKAAMAIWLGLAIDALPESVVIGLLCLNPKGVSIAFIAGVFLANLPEALSASVAMRRSGLSLTRIYLMWWSITLETTLGACVAAAAFPPPPHDLTMVYIMHSIEGLAGGAMLTVICETMLPEAFHEGGKVVGMSALLGFLAALMISTK